MEIIQGKNTDKKIIIAQEIAFAKVLAGNNKTLRDRAVKKLKKWLMVRGNGKWAFTEEEFLRIWTGLFYCMWMSDKFLIQEELAESISSLIHCFKKNSESALLFIKCFNKRILMDWEGLDQYRIDKFNMLVRRFLRQTFVYFKEKDWEETLLRKLTGIFYNVVLHRDNALGFVLHFISIYAEELAKVSKGKLSKTTVLILIEPFVKLLAKSKDMRIQKEAEDFFIYLIRQTDTGIEFEEKFNAWREQGYPGQGPHCMKSTNITCENQDNSENFTNDENENEEYDEEMGDDDDIVEQDQPLDPRAGSVHVYLPQIPVYVNDFISLFKKHQNSKYTTNKGRKILKCLTQKYSALNKGRFPMKIKKDSILNEKSKKKKSALKNAKKLLEFTEKINQEPIKTKEFRDINKELEEQGGNDSEYDEEEFMKSYTPSDEISDEETEELEQLVEKVNNKAASKKQKLIKNNDKIKKRKEKKNKKKLSNEIMHEIKENQNELSNELMQEIKENQNQKESIKLRKKKKDKKLIAKKKKLENGTSTDDVVEKTKKIPKVNGVINGLHEDKSDTPNVTPVNKTKRKHKILSNWQVQELDPSSPEYYDIKTPKIIRLEKKISDNCCEEQNAEEVEEDTLEEKNLEEKEEEKSPNELIIPDFWQKARHKVLKKSDRKSKVFVNPFAKLQNESKSSSRRISFALDKNMAQENEQYLEEVKNSPKVPFDGSKKPVQSALKSGLAPTPVNPFYRFKKIKF